MEYAPHSTGQGNQTRISQMKHGCLRARLKIRSGAVFVARAGWQGATKENTLHGSSTEEQRRQPALAAKTLRVAGLLLLGFVIARVTARCGDAPPAPPRPKPKSLAAAPLPIFRLALNARTPRLQRGKDCLNERYEMRPQAARYSGRRSASVPTTTQKYEQSGKRILVVFA